MKKFRFEKLENSILATANGWTNEYFDNEEVDISLEYSTSQEITQKEAEEILNKYGWAICEKCGDIFVDGGDCEDCLVATMRNKFYNGKEITKENLLSMIGDCIENDWKNSDLHSETESILEKIYNSDYNGVGEDISYILEKLQIKNKFGWEYPDANLQDVEIIISEGEWYFQD